MGTEVTLFHGAGALGFDPVEAVRRLQAADGKLAAVIERVGPCRLQIKETHNAFAALAEAIVYQQLSGKAAATILGRFRALYPPGRFPSARAVLETPHETLRRAGLSNNKALALKDLALKVVDGVVPPVSRLRRLDDEEIIERLTDVRGIGRWTAEMLLIFRLGRADVLPVHDYGLRKGLARVDGRRTLPSPRALELRGERWRPFRTVASWYLWRALEL